MCLQVMGSLVVVKIFECWNNSKNTDQYEAQHKQLQFMMEMACFNAAFDIVKFQDASTIHFHVRFSQA